MANIPLKTIKFPGLDDTYTVPEVDNTLATAGKAADAKKTGDELNRLKQEFNQYNTEVLGLYPQMQIEDTAVASFTDGADNIPVKSMTVDVTPVQNLHGQANPYPGGGSKNKLPFTLARAKSLNVSGTWNGNVYTYDGVTYTVQTDADGNATGISISGTPTGSYSQFYFVGSDPSVYEEFDISTGSYIFTSDNNNGSGLFVVDEGGTVTNGQSPLSVNLTSGTKYRIFMRIMGTASGTYYPMIRLSSVSDATFAPYSNICPISGFNGANVSVLLNANIWDEEWEVGSIDGTTGEPVSGSTTIRSKNFIPCIPNTEYYFKNPATGIVFYYDGAKTYIGSKTLGLNSSFTTPVNARYLKFRDASDYGNVYNHDISINYPSTDHDYHAYKGHTYSVNWQTEAGTVYGGTLDVTSGVLTVTHGYVDLGTLTWGKANNGNYFTSSLPYDSVVNTNNIVCSDYSVGDGQSIYNGSVDKKIAVAASYLGALKDVVVRDTAYANADASAFKTGMNGVQLVYPLATPQTIQLTPTEVATILGQNNIFCDTGDIAELTYRADLKAYIDSVIS